MLVMLWMRNNQESSILQYLSRKQKLNYDPLNRIDALKFTGNTIEKNEYLLKPTPMPFQIPVSSMKP